MKQEIIILDEINYDNLMSEKYKKTGKYLNCVEHFLILVSTVASCVSISAFSFLLVLRVLQWDQKFVKSLQELKSINKLSRKRRRNIIE